MLYDVGHEQRVKVNLKNFDNSFLTFIINDIILIIFIIIIIVQGFENEKKIETVKNV